TAVSRCNIRYLYRNITCHLTYTCQSPSFAVFLIGNMPGLWGIYITLQNIYFAFSTGSITAARGIDSYVYLPGCFQQILIFLGKGRDILAASELKSHFKHRNFCLSLFYTGTAARKCAAAPLSCSSLSVILKLQI